MFTDDYCCVDNMPSLKGATLLSSVRIKYHTYVIDLLGKTDCPGLRAEDLIAFKQEYGPSAFVCPVYGCDKAVYGYSSASHLTSHSTRHQNKLRCLKQDCFYNDIGFTSSRHLREHQRRCHPPQSPPSIPRQIVQNLGQVSQGSFTSSTNSK